jgi:hypothetical protein
MRCKFSGIEYRDATGSFGGDQAAEEIEDLALRPDAPDEFHDGDGACCKNAVAYLVRLDDHGRDYGAIIANQ